MTPLEIMFWGALGTIIGGTVIIGITWFAIFPWSLRRWMGRASTPGTKEQAIMINLAGLMLETFINFLPQIFKKDRKGNWKLPKQFKNVVKVLDQYASKRLQLEINKVATNLPKQLSKSMGLGGPVDFGAIMQNAGITPDSQIGGVLSMIQGLGGAPGGESQEGPEQIIAPKY